MRSLCSILVLAFSAAAAGAQTVTVTRPGEPPTVVPCPAPGCAVEIAIPAPPVEPPPPPPQPCAWIVAPTAVSFEAGGGTAAVTATPNRQGCTLPEVTSSAPWLTVIATATGVSMTAGPNSGQVLRSAGIQVAATSVSVTQAASAPLPPDPPPPTGSALWRLNCTAENFPSCGTGYWGRETSPGVYQGHRVTRVGNGARFMLTPQSSQQQFYLGWQPTINSTAQAIWLRFYLTIHSPFNASGVGDVWTDKLVIVNNGGSTRAIGELRPVRTNTDVTIGIQKGIEGGVTLTPRQDLQIGRRYAVQMRIARGTAVRFATCLDAATEAACVQSGTFSFNVDRFQNVGLGFYSNAAVSASGNVDFTIEQAEIGTAFDANFR